MKKALYDSLKKDLHRKELLKIEVEGKMKNSILEALFNFIT